MFTYQKTVTLQLNIPCKPPLSAYLTDERHLINKMLNKN